MARLRAALADCAGLGPEPAPQVERLRTFLTPVVVHRYDAPEARLADLAEVEAAVTDLVTRGFSSEEMRIYSGRAGSEELSQLGGEGLLGTIRRALEDYGGAAKDLTDRLEAETARGRHVIVVPLPDPDEVDLVGSIRTHLQGLLTVPLD